ncbi:MAG: hypothetical protein K5790_04700 [Nitrosopumilus sp.]|uniref:hypothetical protein n=1 Tax=Nitrosopumilus sp. TaxID=2024843 RepID=UPI00247EEFB0|nr:hypothetical protein [Nitrosopumilus sp.]MCV0392579.1 hypothetical protein [Nitrosopumilus sp.]
MSVLLFSNYVILESHAETLKQSTEKRCKNFYEKFKNLGEDGLRKRYPAHPTLDACLKLFNSHNWTFVGKDLVDEKYLSFLTSITSKSQSNPNIISKMKIGHEQYLVKFSLCSENNQKSKYVLIISDKEQFYGNIPRPFEGKCGSFWAQISAKNPDTTEFFWIYDSLPPSKMVRKLL